VAGASRSFVGGVVCTSGSATGEHCEVRINAVNLIVKTTRGTFSPMVKASVPAGQIATGKGNSGGPVYFGNADGSVNAAGSISAIPSKVLVTFGDHVVRPCSKWSRTRAAATTSPIFHGLRLMLRRALKVV
jgi:hypothetical protein